MSANIFANSQYERKKVIADTIESLKEQAEKIKIRSHRKTSADISLLTKITAKIVILSRVAILEASFNKKENVIKNAMFGKERFSDGSFAESVNLMVEDKLDFVLRNVILSDVSSPNITEALADLGSLLRLINWYESKNK